MGAKPSAVLFTFDDSNLSIYQTAYPILEAAGYDGTFYVIEDEVDAWSGYVTTAELQTMYANGWDISDHTVSHANLSSLNLSQQEYEIGHCADWLEGLGFTRSSHHLGFPLGAAINYNADTLTAETNQGILTGRTTITTPEYWPVTDIHDIKGMRALSNVSILATETALLSAARSDQVYIYYIHKVGNPASESLICNTTLLQGLVDYCTVNSIPVLTISEFYAQNNNEYTWSSGHNYRKIHYISGSTAGVQTNYPVMLNLSNTAGTSSGNLMYLDGHSLNFPNDLRFRNETGFPLFLWNESVVNTTYATLWINLTTIPTSPNNAEIWCYYGNSTEQSASNGSSTFSLFFDHFLGTSGVDPSKYTLVGVPTTANSIVTINNYNQMTTIPTFPTNTSFRTNASSGYTSANYWGYFIAATSDYSLFYPNGAQYRAVTVDVGSVTTNLGTGYTGYHIYEGIENGTGSFIFNVDNSLAATHTSQLTTTAKSMKYYIAGTVKMYVDWVLVRPYVYPEPSHGSYGSEESLPIASFSGIPLVECTPFNVQFTDTSTTLSGTITAWNWSFGDGQYSNDQNPTHTYTLIGPYDVTLTVTNSGGLTDSELKPAYIVGAYIADFSGTPLSGTNPLTVDFTDLSCATTTAWNWSFGDGSPNATTEDTSHTYTTNGTYTVSLTAWNGYENATVTKTAYVNVGMGATPTPTITPTPNFTYLTPTPTPTPAPGDEFFTGNISISFEDANPAGPSKFIVYNDTGYYVGIYNSIDTIDNLVNGSYVLALQPSKMDYLTNPTNGLDAVTDFLKGNLVAIVLLCLVIGIIAIRRRK